MDPADPLQGLSSSEQGGDGVSPSPDPEPFARPENIYQATIGAIIAARAFQDWDRKGPPQGMDLQDWLTVEAELHQIRDLAQRLEVSKAKLLEAVRQFMQREEVLRLKEEALKASEALYHALVDNLPVRVLHKDPQGRFIF